MKIAIIAHELSKEIEDDTVKARASYAYGRSLLDIAHKKPEGGPQERYSYYAASLDQLCEALSYNYYLQYISSPSTPPSVRGYSQAEREALSLAVSIFRCLSNMPYMSRLIRKTDSQWHVDIHSFSEKLHSIFQNITSCKSDLNVWSEHFNNSPSESSAPFQYDEIALFSIAKNILSSCLQNFQLYKVDPGSHQENTSPSLISAATEYGRTIREERIYYQLGSRSRLEVLLKAYDQIGTAIMNLPIIGKDVTKIESKLKSELQYAHRELAYVANIIVREDFFEGLDPEKCKLSEWLHLQISLALTDRQDYEEKNELKLRLGQCELDSSREEFRELSRIAAEAIYNKTYPNILETVQRGYLFPPNQSSS